MEILSMDMSFILKNTGLEERHTTAMFVLKDRLHIHIRNFSAQCGSVGWEIDENPSYYDTKNLVQNQEYLVGAFKADRKTLRRLQWIST